MKRNWSPDELAVHWTLADAELQLLPDRVDDNRLGFAAHLKFFELEGRFLESAQDIPAVALRALATQLHLLPSALAGYDWSGRARKHHRAQIRTWFGFRPCMQTDRQALHAWLYQDVLPGEANPQHLHAMGLEWCRDHHLEPPTTGRLERLIRSAVQAYEHALCEATSRRLIPATQQRLDVLRQPAGGDDTAEAATADDDTSVTTPFVVLKTDPGPVGLASVLHELAKFQHVTALALSSDLFAQFIAVCRSAKT